MCLHIGFLIEIFYPRRRMYTVPIDEIRQGCSRQDCIPSVDSPEFISTKKL